MKENVAVSDLNYDRVDGSAKEISIPDSDGSAKEISIPDSDGSAKEISIPDSDFYSTFVARRPWFCWILALTTIVLVAVAGASITLFAKDFNLGGASEGFENRGSALSGEINLDALMFRAECTGEFSLKASGNSMVYNNRAVLENPSVQRKESLWSDCYDGYVDYDELVENQRRRRLDTSMRPHDVRMPIGRRRLNSDKPYNPNLVSEGASGDVMRGSFSGVVFTTTGSDLMTVDALRQIAVYEATITESIPVWSKICKKDFISDEDICRPSRSLPNYVAALAETTLDGLTEADVNEVKTLLQECREVYDTNLLVGNCWDFQEDKYVAKSTSSADDPACNLDVSLHKCARYNAVYDIFYALTPIGYLSQTKSLKLTQSILQNHDFTNVLETWSVMEPLIGKNENSIVLDNIYFGRLKDRLFNEMMTKSTDNFALLFVLVSSLILLHTGSIWITVCGSFQIIMAFAWGFFFYNVVLWRPFFPFLNLVALFLIMGIGADDLFVFVDAWKQSFAILPSCCPLENRLSWVMRRAFGAMFITTITTTVSFLANAVNSVTALKCFGLFTASVVMADFCLMIIFLPASVVLHHLHFSADAGIVQNVTGLKSSYCSNCATCHPHQLQVSNLDITEGDDDVEMRVVCTTESSTSASIDDESSICKRADLNMENEEVSSSQKSVDGRKNLFENAKINPTLGEHIFKSHKNCACLNCCCCVSALNIDYFAVSKEIDPKTGRAKQRWIENIFEFKISPILFHDKFRWIIFGTLFGIAIWLTTHAKNLQNPTSDYMQMLQSDHSVEIYEKTTMNQFDIKDGNSFNYPYKIYFGQKPIDNGDPFVPEDRGTIELASSFDASSTASQKYLLDLCQTIADWELTPQTSLNLDQNPCIMFWFKTWMETPCGQTGLSGSGEYLAKMPERSSCCGKSSFPYSRTEFTNCLGDFSDYWADQGHDHGIWWKNGEVKMIHIEGSTKEKFSRKFDDTDKFYGKVKDWFKTVDSIDDMPEGVASTEINFYALQKAIADGAWESAGWSAIFAVLVLVVLTRRLLSSVFSAFQIVAVVSSILGVFVLLGWELNIIESVIMSTSVGIACDFSVHLAHAFNESRVDGEENTSLLFPRNLDELRTHYTLATKKAVNALKELGVTLSMGFLSTFFAGAVLMINRLYFFQQFGIFMCTLMAFSISYAFGFLMPFLASVGWIDRLLADWAHKNVPFLYNRRGEAVPTSECAVGDSP